MKLNRIAAGLVALTTALTLSACGGNSEGQASATQSFAEGTTMA